MDEPASVFQSINPIYIVLLGPIFAGLWLWLNRKGWEPSTPAKFGIGIILLGSGFLVLVAGAAASGPALTPVLFIFLIYLPHTRSDEHTSELQSLMRTSYAVFCLKKKTNKHLNY